MAYISIWVCLLSYIYFKHPCSSNLFSKMQAACLTYLLPCICCEASLCLQRFENECMREAVS